MTRLRGPSCPEGAPDSLLPVLGGNGEVMQIAPPPVVAADDRADDSAVPARDEAQAGVALQVAPERLRRIGVSQRQPLGGYPELEHGRYVGGLHRRNLGHTDES